MFLIRYDTFHPPSILPSSIRFMNDIVCVRVTLLPNNFIAVVLHFSLKLSMDIAVMSCILFYPYVC